MLVARSLRHYVGYNRPQGPQVATNPPHGRITSWNHDQYVAFNNVSTAMAAVGNFLGIGQIFNAGHQAARATFARRLAYPSMGIGIVGFGISSYSLIEAGRMLEQGIGAEPQYSRHNGRATAANAVGGVLTPLIASIDTIPGVLEPLVAVRRLDLKTGSLSYAPQGIPGTWSVLANQLLLQGPA